MSEDFVFIKKYKSVKDFMAKVCTLATVLENIESFTVEPRRTTLTPGFSSGNGLLPLPLTPEPSSPSQASSALLFPPEERKNSETSEPVP